AAAPTAAGRARLRARPPPCRGCRAPESRRRASADDRGGGSPRFSGRGRGPDRSSRRQTTKLTKTRKTRKRKNCFRTFVSFVLSCLSWLSGSLSRQESLLGDPSRVAGAQAILQVVHRPPRHRQNRPGGVLGAAADERRRIGEVDVLDVVK